MVKSQFWTLKLKLKDIEGDMEFFNMFQHQFNIVYRCCFGRFMDGWDKKQVFDYSLTLNNVDLLDASWRREAAKCAQALAKATKEKDEDHQTVIFGGKKNFYDRLKGKIAKEEYRNNRDKCPISCEGSKADSHGNRKFKFDIDTLSGSVRLEKKVFKFMTYGTSKGQMRLLKEGFELVEQKLSGVTFKINQEFLYIIFDLTKYPIESYDKIEGRTLAIDSNPNYTGLSIVDADGTILLRQVFSVKGIDPSKDRDKFKYELSQIAIQITELCKHYHVSYVGFEKLKMKSGDKGKGRFYNRLVNNDWCRIWFFNCLKKHLTLIGCPFQELVAAYSSYVGCMTYQEDTDSIAASLELNRRLRKFLKIYLYKTEPKSDIIFPLDWDRNLFNRWKEEEGFSDLSGWLQAYEWLKGRNKNNSYTRLYYPQYLQKFGLKEIRSKSSTSHVFIVCDMAHKKLCFE